MFETVVNLDLSEDDLYVRHQRVAALFSRDRAAPRDYQFAVAGNALYLRSPEPRVDIHGWRALREVRAGQRYAISGVARIDSARLPPNQREVWRVPPVMGDIVSGWFGKAGRLEALDVSTGVSLSMTKPGAPSMLWTPIHFRGVLSIDTEDQQQAAQAVQLRGVGRGRGFGFGCVHFKEAS